MYIYIYSNRLVYTFMSKAVCTQNVELYRKSEDGRTKGTDRNCTTQSCRFLSVRDDKDACKIPRSLCNDNFYGFMDNEILRHGVRWIEIAAASPILNCIVTYYVEGDRGHLMDESLT